MTPELNTLPPRQFQVRIKRDYREASRDESFQPTTLQEMHAAHVARRARWARLAAEFAATQPKPKPKPKPPPPPAPEPEPLPEKVIHRFFGPPLISEIQRAACQHFGVSLDALVSHRRYRNWVGARQVAIYLAKLMTRHSMPVIGSRFGGRDHTTVLHAVRTIEAKLEAKLEAGEAFDAVDRIKQALPNQKEWS